MFGTKRHKVHTLSVIISLFIFISCTPKTEDKSATITGEAQGTTYTIILVDNHAGIKKAAIDSILHDFDEALSTYLPSSVISQINEADSTIKIDDPFGYFQRCFEVAYDVYSKTEGAFDPTVYPLVDAWGFKDKVETPLDSAQVQNLCELISFEKNNLYEINFSESISVIKKNAGLKFDFNAIAQGYSVDVVAEYLESKGIKDYYVEIGGELRVAGKNRDGVDWRIGIDSPIADPDTRELENILNVTDKAVATSGNYRNFYEKDGVKYAHTLNPKTGWPVNHSLLSATVVTSSCSLADAYATAFMVVGVDEALQIVKNSGDDLEVYLLYADEKGDLKRVYSDGFEKYLK